MVLYVSYGWYYGCLGFRRDIGVVGGWCEGEVLSEMGGFFSLFLFGLGEHCALLGDGGERGRRGRVVGYDMIHVERFEMVGLGGWQRASWA